MSEDRVQLADTFDYSKDITDITLNTNYILGLQQVILYQVENLTNPADAKIMFEKFDKYINGEYNVEENPFSSEEMNLYTTFSLYQLLKLKAYEQGLNIKVEATISQKDIDQMLEATISGDMDKVKEINEKMQEDIKSQLS